MAEGYPSLDRAVKTQRGSGEQRRRAGETSIHSGASTGPDTGTWNRLAGYSSCAQAWLPTTFPQGVSLKSRLLVERHG